MCTRQLNSYTEDIDSFTDAGAQVLAISPQSVTSHDDFSCKQGGFAFPLLADTDKAVGEAYGILGPLGFYRRSAFVIDAEGVVRYAHRAVAGLTFRSTEELVDGREGRRLAPRYCSSATPRSRPRVTTRTPRQRAMPARTQAMPPMYQARLEPP